MDTITKKELLSQTGISYGQLYRWKRQKLIPEEWFIKQASYTGQETVFPREAILNRIRAILDAKDSHSLEELAQIFSPEQAEAVLPFKAIQDSGLLEKQLLEYIRELLNREEYQFSELVLFTAVARAASDLKLTEAELRELLRRSLDAAGSPVSVSRLYLIFSAGHGYHAAMLSKDSVIQFDSGIEVVSAYSLSEISAELKLAYQTQIKKEES